MGIIDHFRGKDSQNNIECIVPSDSDVEKSKNITEQIEKVRGAIGRTEKIANLLDRKLLDPLLGWFFEMVGLPIIGDIPTTIAGLYIVFEAKRAGLPNKKIVQMLANVGIDFALDLIPILGNIADFFVRSNIKNVEIMQKYAEELEQKH